MSAEKKDQGDDFIAQLRGRSENYYQAHGHCCSEAVMVVLNQAFGGGLDNKALKRLGTGFCGGMGGGEGTCGALSGAVAMVGYLLSMPGAGEPLSSRRLRAAVGRVHDRFRAAKRSIICREILARRPADERRRGFCRRVTGEAAAIAAEEILAARPELLTGADTAFVRARDRRLPSLLRRLTGR